MRVHSRKIVFLNLASCICLIFFGMQAATEALSRALDDKPKMDCGKAGSGCMPPVSDLWLSWFAIRHIPVDVKRSQFSRSAV